jgi:putative endonuclease
MPSMYILFSEKLNKYYVCAWIDINLYEHNIGHSKFTAAGTPRILKCTEEFKTLQEAKKGELCINKMKSRKYIEDLIAKGSASLPIIIGINQDAFNRDHKSSCERG